MSDKPETVSTTTTVQSIIIEDPAVTQLRQEIRILAPELLEMLDKRDSVSRLLKCLPKICPASGISERTARPWELVGLYHLQTNRKHEALAIFWQLYLQMLEGQIDSERIHKGMPLVFMSDCYTALDFPVHAKRYLMLALCEDALRERGSVSTEETGAYVRLVWSNGMSHDAVQDFAQKFHERAKEFPDLANYPEALLQQVDDSWLTEFPSAKDMSSFRVNAFYLRHLLKQLGSDRGHSLEILAEYLVSCMPGCRTKRRQRSRGSEYDIVCAMEGAHVDFRSELGRHFVCECKDWDKTVDFTTMSKFCRVLDSTKSRFGILFSKNGVSGSGNALYAESEQRKVFQDRGIIIVVVALADLEQVAAGASFTNILRQKYEDIRLDLWIQGARNNLK